MRFLVKFGASVCEVVLNLLMDHAEPKEGLHYQIVICKQKREQSMTKHS